MPALSNFDFATRMSLPTKINAAIAITFLFVIASVTFYTAHREKARALEDAKEQTRNMTTFYFDSLNTMMLTGTMDQRTLLRNKILRRQGVVDARVIRGQPVKQQFGQGYAEEQGMDDLDTRALKGEEVITVENGKLGRVITVLTPFLATEDTRGVNCLQCHDVPSGAVNGAIRVSFSLRDMDKQVEHDLWIGAGANLLLMILGLGVINWLLRNWITQPVNNFMDAIAQRSHGDTTAKVSVVNNDEIGRLAKAFNNMTDKVNAIVQREHETAETLRSKVDILLDVVSRAAKGDLKGKVRFAGNDAIGELAGVIQIMIDNLRLLIEDKHRTVEDLQKKVDSILVVVTKAAEGDLTGRVILQGDDAIGRLAKGVQRMIQNLDTLVSQVQQSGIQVTSSATEIAATAKQQEATVAQQAATVNDIVATSTQISATAKELSSTMDEVAEVMENTAMSARSGHVGLERMGITVNRIVDSSSSIVTKLEVLSEKARNINTVVTTITKVADQTNLLSLNAAIEAEKAGEYGLGFAVVATEIRRLADQTAVATWDIEQMVKEIQSAVAASVISVENFSHEVKRSSEEVTQIGQQFATIIGQVQALTPRFDAVHSGVHSQSDGAEQIVNSIIQLNESAQQTLESLRHSHQAIDHLKDAAHSLHHGVSKFSVLGAKALPGREV